jgi:hypothetical protein
MRRVLAATVALTALTATAFAAPAGEGTLRGRTSQGYKTRVVVKDGQVQRVDIPWRAKGHCKPRDGFVISFPHWNYTNDPGGPIEQTPQLDRFTDGGRVVDKSRHGRAVVVAHLSGRFVSDTRIEGTQRIQVRSTHDKFGRHRCTAKMRWFAQR